MTYNQIAYQKHLEDVRNNTAQQELKKRENEIAERRAAEEARHNAAYESELERSNRAREAETQRSNLADELERNRHNLAAEEAARQAQRETVRHNQITEIIDKNVAISNDRKWQQQLEEQHRSNFATETETSRHNQAVEDEAKRHNTVTEFTGNVNAAANAGSALGRILQAGMSVAKGVSAVTTPKAPTVATQPKKGSLEWTFLY